MILFHGNNTIVKKPKSIEQNRFLDFGFGFYATTYKEQAINFAKKVAKQRGKKPFVNVYEIDESELKKLNVKIFDLPNEEWVDFVSSNRLNTYMGLKYDVIIGPVANDDVYKTLQLYLSNVLTKEQTLETLKIKKLFNQYVFSSNKALKLLKFKSVIEI